MQKCTYPLVIFLFLCFSARSQESYFPSKENWEAHPYEGFVKSKLDEAIEYAKSHEYSGSRDLRIAILESFSAEPFHEIKGPVKERGGPTGLILKNGFIVAEWGDPERVDMTFSVTKSYLSTVAGIAWQEGRIKLNQPVSEYIWDGTFEGDHNSQITWEHLLNQSSDWSGDLFGMYDWADRPPREGGLDEWKSRKLNQPGTVFEYNDVRVNLLAYSLLQVLRKPLPAVLRDKIMDPIGGSDSWRWYGYDHAWVNVDGYQVQSVTGGGHSGGGLFINSYDHARFGLLFARHGNWAGKQLIAREWIESATQPSPAQANYGLMWWLHGDSNSVIPDGLYSARGFGGNFIVVDDVNDIVIVTRWLEPSELNSFLTKVYEALKK